MVRKPNISITRGKLLGAVTRGNVTQGQLLGAVSPRGSCAPGAVVPLGQLSPGQLSPGQLLPGTLVAWADVSASYILLNS